MDFTIINRILNLKSFRLNVWIGLFSLLAMIPQAMSANRLLDVQYHAVVDHQLEIEFLFENDIAVPTSDMKANPAKLELHFADSVSDLGKDSILIDKVGVDGLQVEQQGSSLHLTLAMEQVLPYQGRVIGNRYRLTVNDAVQKSDQNQQTTQSFVNSIKNIDFKRSQSGGSELIVEFNNRSIAVDIEQVGAKLEVKFFNTEINDDLLYIVDVNDFDTPIKSFETFRDDLISRVMVDVDGEYEYRYNQEGNTLRLNVDKVVREAAIKKEKTYSGKAFTLNFQNISVRTALQIIADMNQFNLIVSDTVEGDITLRLDQVPWDQALDLILQTKGLGKRIEGNILMVAPAEELAIRESQQLKNKQEVEKLAPLFSEYIQINYAKAINIASLLKNEDSSLLTKRGSVAVDERTNTLLVKDTADTIESVHRLVKIIDVPIRQVEIEARVVTVRDNVAEDLGVRWGFSDQQGRDGTSGSLEGANAIANGRIPSLSDRLNVNLPARNDNAAGIAFHVAKLADGTLLDLELSALEQEDKAEIVASPRLTVSNQQKGYISQGIEIPFVQATSSGATSVTFKPAVLLLEVVPQITPDNRVILDLKITQDSRGETVPTAVGDAVSIDTQRIGTQALVKNGDTIVLGGIYQRNLINNVSKVPILGDIPYLGYLFRNTQEKNERRELLIFVTPKIVTYQL
ncbi:type IV pilus secretin PilQ [Parashewanella tropica]|uniref:type IV pilus secretin PilQ n=1 Tax=Parashewanella tropica TaxID=2547970 RepID=UPI00105A40CA|nr:type IV pilus secretin PilQ family protein [Parashewanella tropica]